MRDMRQICGTRAIADTTKHSRDGVVAEILTYATAVLNLGGQLRRHTLSEELAMRHLLLCCVKVLDYARACPDTQTCSLQSYRTQASKLRTAVCDATSGWGQSGSRVGEGERCQPPEDTVSCHRRVSVGVSDSDVETKFAILRFYRRTTHQQHKIAKSQICSGDSSSKKIR